MELKTPSYARVLSYMILKLGEEIPKPPHWGGFRLIPDRVEFWKGRESRLE
jgi:pyridoxamine 5'-phosphate oxidase